MTRSKIRGIAKKYHLDVGHESDRFFLDVLFNKEIYFAVCKEVFDHKGLSRGVKFKKEEEDEI